MRKISLVLLFTLLITTGAGCLGGNKSKTMAEKPTIEIWRVFDDDDTFQQIIDDYRAIHPNVSIKYRRLRYDEYQDELIRAMAEGRGPDIFSVHNTWLPAYQDLIEPIPESTTVSYYETQGTLRKETVVVEKTEKSITIPKLKSTFVDQVAEDVVLSKETKSGTESKIYGLPLAMDSLALFYNKDLLNAAGIPTPPETWKEFQEDVIKLTTYNNDGEITQSGAALGTPNIDRATDIVSVLMMQNGTEMTDSRGRIAFAAIPDDAPSGIYPSYDAVSFYTDFANPTKEVYTWNDDLGNSFDAFVNGKTAFYLGYSYNISKIRTTAPKLNFGVAKLPQIEGGKQINFANYWVEVVSKQTDISDWAWNFLQFAASEDEVSSYLKEAQKPTALRNLISEQIDDEFLGPFAEQTLTARSWYHGYDAEAVEDIFTDMIEQVLSGGYEPQDIMENAARRVADTYKN
ncbi:extracellular solute-binding protein [Candidatus Parcubacteria bacterium]|nr:MAG: extracellular solute-binding protein [Candidatus Parcubacteria bacterium]